MNANLDSILTSLTKVRGRNGNYIACCPAHDDRSPSLSIRETSDGKILLHCFGGCSVSDIAGAVGVDLSDLFPPNDTPYNPDRKSPTRARFIASDLLRVIAFEATVVAICAHELGQGRPLNRDDKASLGRAVSRINEALEYGNG